MYVGLMYSLHIIYHYVAKWPSIKDVRKYYWILDTPLTMSAVFLILSVAKLVLTKINPFPFSIDDVFYGQ